MKRRLAVSLLLYSLAAAAIAAGDFGRARGIIGILPLPEVFGNEPCAAFKAQDVELFRGPQSTAPIGRIFVSKPSRPSPAGGCEGAEVSVSVSGPVPRNGNLPTLEFAYENPGAVVLTREGQWFEIALDAGTAWVRIQDGARYLPVERLLKDSLSYLRGQGRSALLDRPGQGKTVWSGGPGMRSELPVEVMGFRNVSGKLWVQVSILGVEPCTGQNTNVRTVSGWLPFHDASGMPAVWFHSRGC